MYLIDDDVREETEEFRVQIILDSDGVTLGQNTTIIQIVDDDSKWITLSPPPSLTLSPYNQVCQ